VSVWRRLAGLVETHGLAALVTIRDARGSTPREAGARMAVRPDSAFTGTIGGGRLEWEALALARRALESGRGRALVHDAVLGPDLGQCCGGRVTLLVETFDGSDLPDLARLAAADGALACSLDADGRVRRTAGSPPDAQGWAEPAEDRATQVALFGAGHVGRALVLALAPLPFSVTWFDSRAEAFPAHIPANATSILALDPVADLAAIPPGAFVVVTTHDHALDLALTAAALSRDDLPFVGLIGSATKRARFEKRFREIGLTDSRIAALSCPIGLPAIPGKHPATIAAGIAAQLLVVRGVVSGE
jgi:xanthine dehydrogenase accessory factor